MVVLKHGCRRFRPTISTRNSVGYFIVVWEVSDMCILIVDNGNELHYCSQTQKYCMRNVSFHTVTLSYLILIIHCVSLCLKNVTNCLAITLTYMHELILTVFGSNAIGKVSNQNMLYFPTSPI